MSVAKLSTFSTLDASRSDEGNDSLDTLLRQAIGKQPVHTFSRLDDNPAQWVQLLHGYQPDIPGWPLLTTWKTQMQKCEKCSREFCSPVNYRRHIRLHRRSLNFDKDSRKLRGLLGAFWDKLTLEEVKEVVSLNDISLKEIQGTSLVKDLSESLCGPRVWTLPPVFVKAGSTLLDIIQAKPCGLPASSNELFSILDDASEKTFLCAGTAETVQKYVFDGGATKFGLELKNLIACTCFLFEQKLMKAWLADKDAEALRCQKLLVEEEEADMRRKAKLLETKRQKKLRQKEQKARDQTDEAKGDLCVSSDSLDDPLMEEIPRPPAPSDETLCFGIVCSSNEGQDIEAQNSLDEHIVNEGQNGEPKLLQENSQRPPAKHGPINGGPVVNNYKVWTRKIRVANNESFRDLVQKNGVSRNPSDCDVMIGSISVPMRNCTQQDSVHKKHNVNGPTKLWRPVSRHDKGRQYGDLLKKVHDQTLSNKAFLNSPESNTHAEGSLPFCGSVARDFLAQRWKEVMSADHVELVLSFAPSDPPECPHDTIEAT
ncbi:unnamed protein product [Cuscuta epithymum]|uniref:C2H2-type domain-containing protein n=1 Tax=Cuscuta epithymum TaxID=186058 RepID=A0AAV0BZN2_9ASTE|nr:unnamed protein product [Cuscuta epithymum]